MHASYIAVTARFKIWPISFKIAWQPCTDECSPNLESCNLPEALNLCAESLNLAESR